MIKIGTQFSFSFIFGLLFGFLGLIGGIMFYGRFGCVPYGGLDGYEACGIFFAFLGLILGQYFAVIGIGKWQDFAGSKIFALLSTVVVFILAVTIMDSYMGNPSPLVMLSFLFIGSFATMIGYHWRFLMKKSI